MLQRKLRYPFLDFLRGIAILLMIFFHFCYDLNFFGFLNIDFNRDLFWFILPRVIVFLFLICVGLSLEVAYNNKIKWKKFFKNWSKIVVGALAVSLVTHFAFKENWVYFGTLHCIAAGQILSLPFLKKPRLALTIGLLMFSLFLFSSYDWVFPPEDYFEGKSVDFIPLFPWMGIILFGIFCYSIKIHQWSVQIKWINLLGQHSLMIYLIHQPILFVLVYLAFKILGSGISH